MNYENIISKKKKGFKLSYEEIDFLVSNFTNGTISEDEMSVFLRLVYDNGLSFNEIFYLTKSMVNSGDVLSFDEVERSIVDKHSTGGVGDKITLLVSPIVASCGVGVLKMSGRGLGLTGGTVDKLESINGYNISLNRDEVIKQVNEIGVSVIGQTESIATADKKIYALRDKIGTVDSIPLIASSIMSKKIASGAPSIVIDLKVGEGAFMTDKKSAMKLAKVMSKIGKKFRRKMVIILSNMNAPIGKNIGNSLEVNEVIDFFNGESDGKLRELVVTISAYMLKLGKKISYNSALKEVIDSIESGSAKECFYKWISYQNGDINNLKDNAKSILVKSKNSGYIESIDVKEIAVICNELGAGRYGKRDKIDYAVGVKLNKVVGEYVNLDEVLGTIYYNDDSELEEMKSKFIQSFNLTGIKNKEKDIIIKVIE